MKKTFFILAILVSTSLISSCYYDKEDLLYGSSANCDTTVTATYSTTIAPILTASCNGCHSTASPSGNIALDNYAAVKAQVTNGKLIGSISHSVGYSAMPKGGAKLPDCSITKIRQWINAGALNN